MRRIARLPMIFPVIVVATIALTLACASALAIAHYSFGWPWGETLPPKPQPGEPTFLDALKLGLTIGAGFGGAVALVVAYRRQGIHERQEPRERYGAAVAQLGSENATARLAGVYALANLADEWHAQRQQCVDVLCAYLRLPWQSTPDDEHPLAARTISKTVSREPDESRTYTYRDSTGETEVRKTIVRVIADHLRPTGAAGLRRMRIRDALRQGNRYRGGAWSHLQLDFTNAALPHVNMSDCVLPPKLSFGGATFTRDAVFVDATFTGAAWFSDATFTEDAWFSDATFTEDAWFSDATFTGDAVFSDATFTGAASFDRATLGGTARGEIAAFLTPEQLAKVASNAE
ncbi:MAG: pentapeptide repeat-containing protein [Nocardioides sp.]